ncbi:hypothetical protein J6590_082464, partial [Homalodisca vitripennis]
KKTPSRFDHSNLKNVWVKINGHRYPAEMQNCNIATQNCRLLYDQYLAFRKLMYGDTDVYVNIEDFKSRYPMIVDTHLHPTSRDRCRNDIKVELDFTTAVACAQGDVGTTDYVILVSQTENRPHETFLIVVYYVYHCFLVNNLLRQFHVTGATERFVAINSSNLGIKDSPCFIQTRITREVQSIKNRKVLLMTDSHGRMMGDMLSRRLGPGYDISALFRPWASLSRVVHDIEGMIDGFTQDDIVVIVGDTNDIGDG